MAFASSGTIRFSTASGLTRSINHQLGQSSTASNSSLDTRHDFLFDWMTKPNWTSGNPSEMSEFYGADDSVGGGGCCILEGSRVTLKNGDAKKVEDLRVGDELLSYQIKDLDENGEENKIYFDFNTTTITPLLKTVTTLTGISSTKNPNIVEINNQLRLTDYDIMLMYKKNGDPYGNHSGTDLWLWLPVQALEVGDKIIGKNFQEIQVTHINNQRNMQSKRTFTLNCEPYDWYYADGILVHNKGGCGGGP